MIISKKTPENQRNSPVANSLNLWEVTVFQGQFRHDPHERHTATDIWEVTVADRPCWHSGNQRWTISVGRKMSC